MLFLRGEGGGGGKGPRRPSRDVSAYTRRQRAAPVCRRCRVMARLSNWQRVLFPFRVLRFELQRGVGIGMVLVRARAFVDGLEKRSATIGIQIFNLDHGIDRGHRSAPRDGDIPDLDEALKGKAFTASFDTAIWTLRLPELWERTAQLALALNLCFRASPPEAGRPGV